LLNFRFGANFLTAGQLCSLSDASDTIFKLNISMNYSDENSCEGRRANVTHEQNLSTLQQQQ
jgi:hypothetical protein